MYVDNPCICALFIWLSVFFFVSVITYNSVFLGFSIFKSPVMSTQKYMKWHDASHICVFLLKNPSWDLSSLASFLLILLSTQSIHEMSLHKTLHFKKHEFLFQMYTCSLLAIQMYHPCFQSYFRKRRVLISFTGRKE